MIFITMLNVQPSRQNNSIEIRCKFILISIMAYRLDGVADASLLCIACFVYTDCIVICEN